eukprot:SAG11_NODE_1028_length_6123_cov_1.537517_7_plen_214_part_01
MRQVQERAVHIGRLSRPRVSDSYYHGRCSDHRHNATGGSAKEIGLRMSRFTSLFDPMFLSHKFLCVIALTMQIIDVTKGIQTQTAECVVIGEILADRFLVVLNKVDLLPEASRERLIEKATADLRSALGTKLGQVRSKTIAVVCDSLPSLLCCCIHFFSTNQSSGGHDRRGIARGGRGRGGRGPSSCCRIWTAVDWDGGVDAKAQLDGGAPES